MKRVKKNTHPRGAKKAPQPTTTPLPIPWPATIQRPDPDPEDLAIADAEDPCLDEPGVLFCPRLHWIAE